jgi:transcriptional regulator GlxA family with amidase domain
VDGGRQSGARLSRFDAACHHVRCNLCGDLRLDIIAKQFDMAPSSFSHWFHGQAQRRGMPGGYKTFVIRARMERAEQLLSTTDLMVRDIATAVGFSSHQLLNQHFRSRHGATPSAWRRAQSILRR